MQRIRELIQKGQIDEAEYRLRDRLNEAPNDPEALNMYGVVLARKGDALGARSHFKRAIEAGPDEPSYLVNYGLLLAQQGDSLRAAEFLERAAALDPNWSRGHAQLGELALASGQLESAEQRFRTALRADENDAQAQVGLAQILLLRGDADQALTLAQSAIAQTPEDPRAQAVLGAVLLAKGHYAFARQALENALKLDPGSMRVRRMTARAQAADNDATAVLATLQKIKEFNEEDVPMLVQVSDLGIRSGHAARVADLLDRVLGRVDNEPRLVHAAAEARVRAGRIDDAISLLGAYAKPESHPSIWVHQLGLLARQNRVDEAFQLAQAWAEAQPHQAEAHAVLATGAELRGEAALARAAAEKALTLDAQHPKALAIAAAYELKTGKPGSHCSALAALDPTPLAPASRATRGFLLGYAADRVGDSDVAVAHWLEVHASLPKQKMPALSDPLGAPRELPMPLASSDARPLVLVPCIPGGGAEALLRALARGESVAVLTDRMGPHFLEVVPCAERGPRAGKDHGAHALVAGQAVQGRLKGLEQRAGQGIELPRAVEGEDRDRSFVAALQQGRVGLYGSGGFVHLVLRVRQTAREKGLSHCFVWESPPCVVGKSDCAGGAGWHNMGMVSGGLANFRLFSGSKSENCIRLIASPSIRTSNK